MTDVPQQREIETVTTRKVYQNKWMTLREDEIRRQSGAKGLYSVVEKPDFTIIIPIERNDIYMVEQYRYPINERQLEFPQGAWEEKPDASPEALAAGELREETGFIADELIHVGYQYLAYGFCNQGYHIWVARGLTMTQRNLDPEEEGLVTHKLSIQQLEQRIKAGEIKDATSCNAFGLARLKGLI
ncbi:NUDIX hydrolase [Alteromonas pelagimontana]|uniref:GDP-mannose pyrophosphatase n=1 Tax=Alteromonas pelagimontana TaxID=1858656 RepID=A0A6M4M9R5_9ALTE|nr:NUDIX hydrolase [Alteromonas pelagimontana]QJR79719.1 NUDIX hydrolase [Alteromonas pelagimontana]